MVHRILHLCDWKATDITYEVLCKAKDCGFTDIQISPVQEVREDIGYLWNLYQPISFQIGNRIANRADLRQLGTRCENIGLGLIADIVAHHTTTELEKSKLTRLLYPEDRLVYNYENRYENTHFRVGGLPTLDMWNSNVQYHVRCLIRELINCGVTGLRWDACKHIELPCEGCNFFENTLELFPELFQYGELIFTSRDLMEKYQQIMIVGTEDSRGTDESKCVLWVESHDSHNEKWTHFDNPDDVAYKYMELVKQHPNAHTLFYTRPFCDSWKLIKH